ncbi:hypothetical protein FGO68_gene6872 [Halteria grandinella]|uniref:Uncharacterized protein n=1 Tax=Halteria grandinella TaxID=5974 RepID=A0A8J8NUX4_HALGN|nr:hypothetical protein FGO68_gene6872 [Halteria grandinella]
MDVTRENFAQLLPLIRESIAQAEFIGFDTEFSGLNVGFDDRQHDYDTTEDRYQKLKHNCTRMNTFQVGLACFHWDQGGERYLCRPFNFYVFKDSQVYESEVLQFQASCLKFLRENHFDFNKLFSSGITYQRLSQAAEVRTRCADYLKSQQPQFASAISPFTRFYMHLGDASQQLLKEHLQAVEKFVEDTKGSMRNEQMVVKVKSHALKRTLAKEIATRYKDSANVFTEFKKDNDLFTVKKWAKRIYSTPAAATQTKSSPEDPKLQPATQITLVSSTPPPTLPSLTQQMDSLTLTDDKELEELYSTEMGFSHIVQLLIDAKKPIIGHNMMYDIIYLYNQFIAPLPPTYLEFAAHWHALFPSIYDNKVLCTQAEYFGRTDLGRIYEKCTVDEKLVNCGVKVAFDIEKGFGNYEGSALLSHYHEAAYDAYMTGHAFAHCIKFKEFDQGPSKKVFNNTYSQEGKQATPSKEKEAEASVGGAGAQAIVRPPRLNMGHSFVQMYHNKVIQSPFAQQYFILDPALQDEETQRDVSMIVWVQLAEEGLMIDEMAKAFTEFGDYNTFKDSQSSFFLEFYYLEPKLVPTQTIDEFISVLFASKLAEERGIKEVVPYANAIKFKAHNRL